MKKKFIHIVFILLLLAIPIVSSPDFDGTFSLFKIQHQVFDDKENSWETFMFHFHPQVSISYYENADL